LNTKLAKKLDRYYENADKLRVPLRSNTLKTNVTDSSSKENVGKKEVLLVDIPYVDLPSLEKLENSGQRF